MNLQKGFIGCELGQGSASTNVADSENIPEENTFAVWVQGNTQFSWILIPRLLKLLYFAPYKGVIRRECLNVLLLFRRPPERFDTTLERRASERRKKEMEGVS